MVANTEIAFEWFHDSKGYELVDLGPRGLRIVGKGGRLIQTKSITGTTFSAFASVRSAEDLQRFVNRYGLLHAPIYDETAPNGGVRLSSQVAKLTRDSNGAPDLVMTDAVLEGEDVSSHVRMAARFRSALAQAKAQSGYRAATFFELLEGVTDRSLGEIAVLPDRRWGLRVVVRPTSLLNAMLIQLSNALSAGSDFRVCELPSCQKVFPIGSRGTKRRVARFCCDQHRKDHNSKKRSIR